MQNDLAPLQNEGPHARPKRHRPLGLGLDLGLKALRSCPPDMGVVLSAITTTSSFVFEYVLTLREIVGNERNKLLDSSHLKLQDCKMQQDPNESR